MSADNLVLFEIIVFAAVLLLLTGLYLSWRNRKAREPKPEAKPGLAKNIISAVGNTIARETPSATTPQSDMIVVAHDPTSDEWWVEVNGTRYRNLKDIHDDLAARKVLDALGGLQRFAGSIPIAAASRSAPIVKADSTIDKAIALAASNPASGPKFPAPKNSILDQIETVLQNNLVKTPALNNRNIHIGSAPDGTIIIEVDREFYKSPDEVPEPAVRDFIKSSIQQWERS
jgi:hypothetical protein